MKEIYFVKSGNLSCKVEAYSCKLAVLLAINTYLGMEKQVLGQVISARKKGKNSYLNETFFSTENILNDYFDQIIK